MLTFSSVQFSHSVVSDSLRAHQLQHARPLCPSPTPGVHPTSCPLRLVMSSNHLILCHLLLLPPSVFPNIKVFSNESVLSIMRPKYWSFSLPSIRPINFQDWFPLALTDWISLQSRGLSIVFFNTIVQKHQFFGAQLSLLSNSHIHTRLLEKP